MMDNVVLKQILPFSTRIMLSVLLLGIAVLITSSKAILLAAVLIVLGFFAINYAYVFNKNGKHEMHVMLFGSSLVKLKRSFIAPKYISLFHQSFKDNRGFGFYPPMFGESKFKSYTIKLFNEDARETIFVSNKKEEVLELGTKLAGLLDVELHNTLK